MWWRTWRGCARTKRRKTRRSSLCSGRASPCARSRDGWTCTIAPSSGGSRGFARPTMKCSPTATRTCFSASKRKARAATRTSKEDGRVTSAGVRSELSTTERSRRAVPPPLAPDSRPCARARLQSSRRGRGQGRDSAVRSVRSPPEPRAPVECQSTKRRARFPSLLSEGSGCIMRRFPNGPRAERAARAAALSARGTYA